ncbi:hypothetical protein H5410_050036 [Solanum commersonii]|uniref:GAG-pre-integrase domain-containing protein n=1 Tax=Solanum commersonii TaxID=4109 RepID=A0A9J5WUC2_SOLCO|nr:hypothetical protein H5410_050036 [Solanum commersonii]
MSKPRPHSSSSYDPNAFCDYCNRIGHTQVVCYQLHGYPPGYERKKRGSVNNYQGRGRFNNDRRTHPAAHNVVSESDQFDYSRGVNQRNQSYGRDSRQHDQVDYHKGMNVLHEQYNHILHMLGQSNLQEIAEGGSASTSTSHSSANLAQDTYSSTESQTTLWHQRLGHTFSTVLARVLDLSPTRDVLFRETIFPFATPSSNAWQLFPPIVVPPDPSPIFPAPSADSVMPTGSVAQPSVSPPTAPPMRRSQRSSKAPL